MRKRRKMWKKTGSMGKEEGERGGRREKEREEEKMREYMDGTEQEGRNFQYNYGF